MPSQRVGGGVFRSKDEFIEGANRILEEELSGYRFVSDQLVQITSEQEIVAIEEALAVPGALRPVHEHIKQAVVLLARKPEPDFRNSIKESISAIESVAKILAKKRKATLSDALSALSRKAQMHPSLKQGFEKLYGYTSDDDGIRHALLDEANLDMEDARFMLVSCSAFVNYLVVKAQKAGISL